MALITKDPSDIDVGSLTDILANKGFTPNEVRAHLKKYSLPVPDMTRIAAFQKTAQAMEDEVESVIRDAAIRLGSVPSADEESWMITEAARHLADERLADIILEGGTSPSPDSPPKGINPKAMDVWKNMFKEHGKEISKAKKAKQWGVAVAIFKNLAKKEGYEPFVEKTAWALSTMTPKEIAYTITTLTALAENLDVLGQQDLADQVDILTSDFEERLTEQTKKMAMETSREHLARIRDIDVMPFEDFCRLVAQSIDAIKTYSFDDLFRVAADTLRKQKNAYLHAVKQHYSIYASLFEEEKQLYKHAPPEILEEAVFTPFLSYVHDAIVDIVRVIGGDDYYDEDLGIPSINRVKLKNYLNTKFVAEKIYEVVSRSPLWREQFGI